MEWVWLASTLAGALGQWTILRNRSAAFRWKWHAVASALPFIPAFLFVAMIFGPTLVGLFVCSFLVCTWAVFVLGVEFCRTCGTNVRQRTIGGENWPRCPKCQAGIDQTPPTAPKLHRRLWMALLVLLAGVGGALASESVVGTIAALLVGLGWFARAAWGFWSIVQLPARSLALRADT